jgi:hypothetical protein
MTDQDDDDEIREAIPCTDGEIPHGYRLTGSTDGTWVVRWRGKVVVASGSLWRLEEAIAAAWDHAIKREKARRVREAERNPTLLHQIADSLLNVAHAIDNSAAGEYESNLLHDAAAVLKHHP